MNVKFVKVISKAAPIVKRYGPMVVGGITGIVDAISNQQAAARLDGMEKRIADLEKLLNNK